MSGNLLTVSVLCPSGHTVTVKVSPNDPVLKIVEQVCTKRQLDPAKHQIKHASSQRPLDVTSPIRYANLTNHAKLELIEDVEGTASKIAASGPVTVAFQVEGSGRVTSNFEATTTLLDALKSLEKDDKISFSERENAKEKPIIIHMNKEVVELEATTFKSLGILPGTRVLLRLTFKDPGALTQKSLPTTFNAEAAKKPKQCRNESPPRRAMRVDDGRSMLEKLREKEKEEKGSMDLTEGSSTKEQAPGIQDQVKENIKYPEKPKEDLRETPEEEATMEVEENVTAQHERKVEDEPEPEILHYLDDEEKIVAFSLGETGAAKRAHFNIDDSFFDLTVDEVRKLYQDRVKEVKELTEGTDLVTSNIRESRKEAEKLNLLNRYGRTVIRVQFPDRHVLQMCLNSYQNVKDVCDVVKKYIFDANLGFDLFTTPPKEVLNASASLVDSGCVPSAVVHFTLKDQSSLPESYLKPEVMKKLSNLTGAAKAVETAGVIKKSTASQILPKDSGFSDIETENKVPNWLQKGKQN